MLDSFFRVKAISTIFYSFPHFSLHSKMNSSNPLQILPFFFLSFFPSFLLSLPPSLPFFLSLWLRWVLVPVRAFLSCGDWGLLFVVVRGLLTAVDSLVVEHGI